MYTLFIVIAGCVIVYGQLSEEIPPVAGGFTSLDESRWDAVGAIVERSLIQLANEQGHHFKLVKLHAVQTQVVAGISYIADGEFENKAGKKLNCHFTLHVEEWTNFDQLTLKCAEKNYVVTRGLQ